MSNRYIASFFLFMLLCLISVGCGGSSFPCASVTCPSGQTCMKGVCFENCTSEQTQCGAKCANTKTDANNCGGCGLKCREGEVCAAGKCEAKCSDGKKSCSGTCVDTQTNVVHCGACGTACKVGERCNAGKCELFCSTGTTKCGDKCYDTSTNNSHCGACNNACKSGEVCSEGKCISPCGAGQTDCSGTCADLKTDSKHCGTCGTACKDSQVCNDGKCGLNCPQGQTACGEKCYDTNSSLTHCGACDKACTAGQVCSKGSCTLACQKDQTDCSGECANLKTNSAHCGACGNACKAGQACINGACALVCKAQETNCSGACVNLKEDPKNCNACGQVCQTDGCCEGTCMSLQDNNTHCGACGNKCTGGKLCSSGKCECPKGLFDCGGTCVDTMKSNTHCGACNNACKVTEACIAGKCNPAWVVKAGGTTTQSFEGIRGMASDGQGNLYVYGSYGKEIVLDSTTLTSTFGNAYFVAKFDSSLKNVWAKTFDSFGSVQGIAVDNSGNAYIVGSFSSPFQTIGTTTLTGPKGSNGRTNNQVFVAKINTSGAWQWAVQGGSADNNESGQGITVDTAGNVYVVGDFSGSKATEFGNSSLTSKGSNDIFVAKLNSAGIWQWANDAGGTGFDQARAVQVDAAGNIFVGGLFSNSSGFGSSTLTSRGSYDAFVGKLNSGGTWQWANGGGSTSTDYVYDIAVDKSNNAYISGYVRGGSIFGTYTATHKGSSDVFVAKIDSNGLWGWVSTGGGRSSDYGYTVDVDGSGNVYVGGRFYTTSSSTSFATFGTIKSQTQGSSSDMFVGKLNSSGAWQWVTPGNSAGTGYNYGLALDSSGNVYAAGYFYSDAKFGSTTMSNKGSADIYLAQLNSSGKFSKAKSFSGLGVTSDYTTAITQDSSGNTYITGYFSGNLAIGTTTLTSKSSSNDLYVAKVSPTGSWLWAASAGGNSTEQGEGIAVDSAGNVYITGYAYNEAAFGTYTFSSQGSADIFVAKLNSSGAWQWVKGGGSKSYDIARSIAVDGSGNIYVTGACYSTGKFGSKTFTSNGSQDVFVAKMDNKGVWQWVTNGGSSSSTDEGMDIALDTKGNVYVSGFFYSGKFGTLSLTSKGSADAFVGKLNSSGAWQWVKSAGGTGYDQMPSLALDKQDNIYLAGVFSNTVTVGTSTFTSKGGADTFVAKMDATGKWLWAQQANGTDYIYPTGIDVNSSGTVFVTGNFKQQATFGTTNFTTPTGCNMFVSALDNTGKWTWAKKVTTLVCGSSHQARDLIAGKNGEAFVAGHFDSSATFGNTTLTSTGGSDIFVWLVTP